MTTRKQLADALMNAHRAGDARAAQILAQELRNFETAAPALSAPEPTLPAPEPARLAPQPARPAPEPALPAPESNPVLREDAQGPAQAGDIGFESFGRSAVGRTSRALAAGVNDFVGGISEAGADVARAIEADEVAQALSNTSRMYRDRANRLDPLKEGTRTFDSPTAFINRALRTGGRMLPGIATGNALAGAAAIGADVYGTALQDGKDQGLSESDARERATLLAGVELVSERIPLAKMLTAEGRKGAARILETAGLEAAQESIVAIVEMAVDYGYLDERLTLSETLYKMGEAMALGGAVGGALGAPAAFSSDASPNDSPVAQGVERIEPTLDQAFQNETAERFDDGMSQEMQDALVSGGADPSNLPTLEVSTDEANGENQLRPLGPTEGLADDAGPDRGLDELQQPAEGPADGAVSPAGQPGERGQPDGQADQRGQPEPGQAARALSDPNPDGQPLARGLSPAEVAGVGVESETDGEPVTLALNPIPPAEPALSPEEETALGQELGVLDDRGNDIEVVARENARAMLEMDAANDPVTPLPDAADDAGALPKEFPEPPNFPDPRLQERPIRDTLEREVSSLNEAISRINEPGNDLLRDVARQGGINAESFERETSNNSEETRWYNSNPAINKRAGGKPVFKRNGGMSMDEFGEFLRQRGYLTEDPNKPAENGIQEFVEIIEDQLTQATQEGYVNRAERDWLEPTDKPESALKALTNALEGNRMGPKQQAMVQRLLDQAEGPLRSDGNVNDDLEALWENEGEALWSQIDYQPTDAPIIPPEMGEALDDMVLADDGASDLAAEWLNAIETLGGSPATEAVTDGQDASQAQNETDARFFADEAATNPVSDPPADPAPPVAESTALRDPAENVSAGRADAVEDSAPSEPEPEPEPVAQALQSPEPETDLAGEVNPEAQAIADATAKKDATRNADTDAPLDLDGGLFANNGQLAPDLFSEATITEKASKADPNPTDAQIEADNYKKGDPIYWKGFTIRVENPKGSTRSGVAPDGTRWENTMGAHYGDIKGTKGADGDAVDVFIGPNLDTSDKIFIKDQLTLGRNRKFDEHKVFIGFKSERAATDAYDASYTKGSIPIGDMNEVSLGELKDWLENGDLSQPYLSRRVDAMFSGEVYGDSTPPPELAADLAANPPLLMDGDGNPIAPDGEAATLDERARAARTEQRQLKKRIAVHEKLLDCVS